MTPRNPLIAIICLILAEFFAEVYSERTPDDVLIPGPVNAARLVKKNVSATSTCGDPPAQYCRSNSECFWCNESTHRIEYMTDGDPNTNWQSETWWQWIQANNGTNEPLMVNVTISFNKTYAITGQICVTFKYPRPKQMIIEKSTDKGITWVPLQYYADNCLERFNMTSVLSEDIRRGDFNVYCMEEYSSPNPQEDGIVVFDFLLRYVEETMFWNMTLQQFLSATDVRLQLQYPGTDGQENVDNIVEEVFNQFYYGISDFKVNARCQCNGHGEYCDYPLNSNGKDCDCEHNTAGEDCERCLPLFNNKTWLPATSDEEPNPCEACQCYDHADSCHYNQTLDHGVCDDCYHNTTGMFCERCVEKFYRNMSKPLNDPEVCLPCDCFDFGITNNGTCNQTTGQCECKRNVTGRKCDSCEDTFWGFRRPPVGDCLECHCNDKGTRNGSLSCNQVSGQCPCKSNIHLRTCSECKDGFFSFPDTVAVDCRQCDCDYGGSVEEICEKINGSCLCRSHIQGNRCTEIHEGFFVGYFTHLKYEAELASGNYVAVSYISGVDQEFTGRGYGRISHNQFITFMVNLSTTFSDFYPVIRYTEAVEANVTLRLNVVVCNDVNCSLVKTWNISQLAHGSGLAWISWESFRFVRGQVYHLNLTYVGGMYANSSIEIDSLILLPDLREVRVYTVAQSGDAHGLTTAQIKECWENSTTITGLKNSPDVCRNATFSAMAEVFDGALACSCNSTGTVSGTNCTQFGGQCQCKPGVTGQSCDRCLPGYFNFTDGGCSACNCSGLGSSDLVCDVVTGQCPCKPGVVTRTCGRCNATFFGFHSGRGCVECQCNVNGSADLQCDRNGTCPCKNSTTGKKCDMCRENFFNFTSAGCMPCECHEGGSKTLQCHLNTGICTCKANAEGNKCEQCKNGTYNSDPSNPDGCSPCFCYGRSGTCSSARNFIKSYIQVNLSENAGTDENGALLDDSGSSWRISYEPNSSVSFNFEKPFQGNQLRSYGQLLMLTINYTDQESLDAFWNVTLRGSNRQDAVFNILPAPSLSNTAYHVRLHEHYSFNNLTAYEVQSILAALDSVEIQASFMANGSVNFGKYFQLVSATEGVGQEVGYVENCTCPNNYTELSCGFCNSGFTRQNPGVRSSVKVFSSCVLCSCSNRSKDCLPENGTCLNCRMGSEGDHCERCQSGVDNSTDCTQCIPGFYGLTPSSGGCQGCECVLPNTMYGNSTVCHMTTGQCNCKPMIAGRPCDRCHENAYNTSNGCVDCPECYRLILVEVEKLRVSITELETTLERIQSGRIGDVTFAQRLNVSVNSTRELVTKADQSVVIEEDLRKEIRLLNETLNHLEHVLETQIAPDVEKLRNNLTAMERDRNATERLIQLTRDAIYYSHNLLNSSIHPSVRDAEGISRELSGLVPRFSELAQNFTAAATRQNDTAQVIKNKTENAESIVLRAQNEKDRAVVDQNELDRILSELKMRGDVIQALGDLVNSSAHGLYVNASIVFLRSNETLSEVMQLDPNNSQTVIRIESAAADAKSQAQDLISTAHNLTLDYANLTVQVELTVEEVGNLMARVSNAEGMGRDILNEAQRARREAIEAVQLAAKTHTDAQEMLQILQDFENKAAEAERFAALSLQRAKEANTTSWNAILFAQRMNTSIQATLITAKQGLNFAQRAKMISTSENQNVSVIHNDATSLSQDAARSKYTSGYFREVGQNVTAIKSVLQVHNQNCATNFSVLASKALKTAQDAKVEADNADTAARNVQARVERVVRDAGRLQQVNITRLNELKAEISSIRLNFTQMNTGDIIRELKNATEEQERFVNEYQEKVREKRNEIAELKQLLASLSSVSCDRS